MSSIIKVNNLSKVFGDVQAVKDLSFTVQRGEVYGFLGQNGAGKSTTIRMLLTLIEPTSGDIEIFGLPLRKHRREILKKTGAIIEKPDLYKYLTALENIRIFAAMSGVKLKEDKLVERLAMVGLADRAHSKVKTYSQGMKQRLGIAVALVHEPDLIILDEPINGLDPVGIADMRNLIIHLSRDLGKTIFISSHLLSEIELIANSMLIIDKGKKIAEGKVNELFDPAQTLIELQTLDNEDTFRKLNESSWKIYLDSHTGSIIRMQMHRDMIPRFTRELVGMEVDIISLHARHSLEEYFISITGKQHVGTYEN